MFFNIAACIAAVAAFGEGHPFIAAASGADRAPCPGLNTLANHGYLSRDGRNITDAQIEIAFKTAYGLSPRISNALIGTVKNMKNADGNLDLNRLRQHGLIEHDASLVHTDTAFGQNYVVNQTLLDGFIKTSVGGVMTARTIGQWRKSRINDSRLHNSNFTLSASSSSGALLEAATLLAVFGKEGKVKVEWMQVWLGQEQLPQGFQPSNSSLVSLASVLKHALDIKWHSTF